MPKSLFAAVFAISIALAGDAFAGEAPDYSKEAAVIQNITTEVNFNPDGAQHWTQVLAVKIQSEAAVRQYGVLSFAYASANQQVTFDYVRVRKPDGSLIETPQSSILDVTTGIAAPATYNDIRQKQVPVKALGVGDVLEYSIQISENEPETPGHFWFSQLLVDDMVVLNQVVEISVPANRYVQVSSPNLKPEVHDKDGQRVYLWRYSHLDPSEPADKKASADEQEPPKIELTTFKSWDEVGSWFKALAAPQAAVTPAIQAKAKELTSGLSSDSDKARAIYQYVAMKFRYVSISLGLGRDRPHSAEEVLANQYGDCKDKHTLLAALLKTQGIEAWPALIGVGLKMNANIPSPAAFNHLITVLPNGGKYVWLDTTAEVAPYGLINQAIRDEQALVIPNSGKAFLQKTPADAPFSITNSITSTATLSADGMLKGHFAWHAEGDLAVGLRGTFRQLAPAQWQAAAQQLSYALGFAGDISAVEVENVENIDEPLQYSYDYTRKDYSDWAEHKITFPLPQLSFGPGADAQKPSEPFWAGEPGATTYRASIHLPNGFTLNVPSDVSLTTSFADYFAHYSLKDGTFDCQRKMIIKLSKVALDQWAAYQKFTKDAQTDQTTFISLFEASPEVDNADAEALLNRAEQALQMRRLTEAHDLVEQAEKLNPKQRRLWSLYGYLAFSSGKREEGIADAQKEVELHPDEVDAYGQLATLLTQAGKRDEAIDGWRKALELWPANEQIAEQLVTLLMQEKRYAEILAALDKSIAAAPGNYRLRTLRVLVLLRAGDKARALTESQEIAKAINEPEFLNDLAYALTDSGVTTPLALEWVQRAISQTEQDCAKASLAALEQKDIVNTSLLAAEWDTLGWIYLNKGDIAKAEQYVDAAWRLSQSSTVADHLGQIYEKQGKQTQAIHMWRLALAAQSNNEDAKERLRKAGAFAMESTVHAASLKQRPVSAEEELGRLRTVKLPELPKNTPVGEYFVAVSLQGVQEVEIAADKDAPNGVREAIKAASFDFTFPDNGTEKIVRRGVLSCSAYTDPNCQFTIFPLASTNIAGMRKSNLEANASSVASMGDASVVAATVIRRVEPEYSETARKAGLEGTVLLNIVIDEQGVPQDITVVKSLGMGLDEAANACVRKWRFKPATKNGTPVKMEARMEVNFKLLHPTK